MNDKCFFVGKWLILPLMTYVYFAKFMHFPKTEKLCPVFDSIYDYPPQNPAEYIKKILFDGTSNCKASTYVD